MSIDFPNTPTTGQIYTATNGIVYQWNGTLWTASSTASSAGGDFFATGTGGSLNTSTLTALGVLGNIISGNSSGAYSSARYTPPAGRYCIYGWVDAATSSAAGVVATAISKNGTQILNARSDAITAGAGGNASPYVQVTVDANGTDYFELRGYSSVANTIGNIGFGGYPISGIKGPPGDPPTAQSIRLSHSPASISLGAGTSAFGWDTVDSNTTGGTYSASSFTIPTGLGGVWDVQIAFLGSTTAGNAFGTELVKNGSSILTAYNYAAPFASTVLLSGKCSVAAGDVLQANLYRGATTTIYCNSAGGLRQSWMHLTRVGM